VLQQEGVQYVVAPYEADAQMAYLAIHGHVDVIITEDSDLIAYGCPQVRRVQTYRHCASFYDVSKILAPNVLDGVNGGGFNFLLYRPSCNDYYSVCACFEAFHLD
jgi:hypothetical protein